MNYISVMKDSLSIEEVLLKHYEEDLNYINQFLNKRDILISEFYQIPFCNHIIMLLERLEKNECSSLDDKEMIQEISHKNFIEAQQFLDPLFKKYHVQPNEVEVALIAIYMQAALTTME